MSRVVWGRHSSSNVQKVLWALDEMGLEFEHVVIGGPHGGNDRADFAALTPIRKVPAFQEDDLSLWESHVILRHLVRRHGGVLASPSWKEAAQVDQWMEFTTTTWQPPMTSLFWRMIRLPPDAPEHAQSGPQMAALSDASAILDNQLASRPWLAGDRFSLADITAGTLLFRYYDLDWDRPDRPNLYRWYQDLQQRPAFVARAMFSYDELRI